MRPLQKYQNRGLPLNREEKRKTRAGQHSPGAFGKDPFGRDPWREKEEAFGKFRPRKADEGERKGKVYHIYDDRSVFSEDSPNEGLVQAAHYFVSLTAGGKEMEKGLQDLEKSTGKGQDIYYVYGDLSEAKYEFIGLDDPENHAGTLNLKWTDYVGEIPQDEYKDLEGTTDDIIEDLEYFDRHDIFTHDGKYYYFYSDPDHPGDPILDATKNPAAPLIWERLKSGNDFAIVFVNTTSFSMDIEDELLKLDDQKASLRDFLDDPTNPWKFLAATLTLFHETKAHIMYPKEFEQKHKTGIEPTQEQQHEEFHGFATVTSPSLFKGVKGSIQDKYVRNGLELMGYSPDQILRLFEISKLQGENAAKTKMEEVWKENIKAGQTGIFEVNEKGEISLDSWKLGTKN